MKRILSAVLALCVVSASLGVCAEDTSFDVSTVSVSEEKAAPVVYELTLEQAIEMAYENNPQLEANKFDQLGKEISLESAMLQEKQYRKITVNVASAFETYCLKKGYYLDAAEVQLELSRKEADKISGSVAYDVTEAYYNYVLMQKLVNAANNSYELASENLAMVEAQYNLGLIAKLDYENASISVSMAKNAVEAYKLNMETAEENLKILLHKDDENCTIKVFDDVDCSDYTSDADSDTEAAMESRYDLTALKKSKELAYKYFDLAEILTSDSAIYNTAYASYVKADYDYTNTKKLIALLIKSSYNSILTSKADMDTAQLSYEMKLKEYESAKLKYDLGMITNLQLTQTINELYESQVEFANAKITYRLAVEKYKYEITVGL
ncbi:MAG: TolC family protein [Clostridia bacterium]|nr:TolC family protein [Clostridia bacterium]